MAASNNCYILSDVVTALCMMMNCALSPMPMMVTPIPEANTRISGSVTTTNFIMANWTAQMWQSVLSRALQFIRSGPFGTHFAAASVTVIRDKCNFIHARLPFTTYSEGIFKSVVNFDQVIGDLDPRTDVDRTRHESVEEQLPKPVEHERRFPSPKLDSDQFLKIVSWQTPPDTEHRTSSTPTSDIAETVRSWYGRQSRRRLFVAFVVLLAVLFVIAIVITLLFLFAFQTEHHDHAYTAIIYTLMTPHTQTVTPFPYPSAYVVGTASYYVSLGRVTSLVPETRNFKYRNRLLSYGNDTISSFNRTTVITIPLHLDEANCSSCTLLALDDICTTTTTHRCNSSQTIYCCSKCVNAANFCHIKGILYEFSDELVETQISSDAKILLITTASYTSSSSCALQTHRISADGFTFSGPIQIFEVPSMKDELIGGNTTLTTTTFSPESAISADIVTIVDSKGGLGLYNLTSRATLSYIPMDIQNNVLSISTTVQNDCILVAVLQPSRFYALRRNLKSGCLTVLQNYYESFYFSGELRDSSWAGDTLTLWYVDRDGVNLVQFQFTWDLNSSC